jgi:acetyl-CoA carboxylase beta subunit
MFAISISTLIMIFISFPLILILLMWIFSEKRKRKFPIHYKDQNMMSVCPYCAHVFFNRSLELVVKCPACESFVERELKNNES